jgi:orotidine-5'-phosphate decarboxylase
MRRPVIVALDFPSAKETFEFLHRFKDEKLFVKVGMELYYKEGPSIIEKLKYEGHDIFLDLKLHDIPNTVYHAMKNVASFGVDLVNVHAAGGVTMMQKAKEGLENGTPFNKKTPLCIAVTQLTSTTEMILNEEIGIEGSIENTVLKYAKLTEASGLDGVVCSTWEANRIKEACGERFLTVTPGIRLKMDRVDDQARVADPFTAKQNGSSFIVVGRTITQSKNPVKTYETVVSQWEGLYV